MIIIYCIIIYSSIFNNTFLSWDDNRYITGNPYIKDLTWKGIINIFTTFYDGHYHPLTLISLAIDYEIGELSPWIYQFTNLLLHLVNVLFVYWLVKGLMTNVQIALIVSLLFAIHPMHTESFVWMSERKNVLYSFLFLLSLLSYIKYLNHKKLFWYFISLILFILSCLSKVSAISLVGSLFLIDILYKRKLIEKRVILEKLPFIILMFFLALIASLAQENKWIDLREYSYVERFPFAAYSFVQYVVKLLIPYNLSALYPYPEWENMFYGWLFVPLSLLIVAVWIYAYKRSRLIFFALGFFIVNIVLLLKFFKYPIGEYIMADRYNYISSIGIFIIIGILFNKLRENFLSLKYILPFLLIGYITAISVATINRIQVWKNDLTFFNDISMKNPRSIIAWNNLGMAYRIKGDLNMALNAFERTMKLDSLNTIALSNYGNIKAELKDFNAAITIFNRLIKINPRDSGIYYQRGLVELNMGNWSGAIKDFDITLQHDTTFAECFLNRGVAKSNSGNLEDALPDFNKAILINKDYSKAYFNRGNCYAKLNDFDNAELDFNYAISLNREYISAYLSRAKLFLIKRQYEKAKQDIDYVLSIDSNNKTAIRLNKAILNVVGN